MRSLTELRAAVDTLSVDAQVLLVRAQHEQMKDHVRTAIRDLAEASRLLNQQEISARDRVLAVIDESVKSSTLRLEMVETALRTAGPNASDLS